MNPVCEDRVLLLKIMKKLLYIFSLLSILGCTTTKYVEVPIMHKEYIEKVDTFIKTDSIYEKEFVHIKGDTVYMERTKYIQGTIYQPKCIEVVKTDSIPYPIEVIKEVPRKANWLEQTLMVIGAIVLLGLVFIFLRYLSKIK